MKFSIPWLSAMFNAGSTPAGRCNAHLRASALMGDLFDAAEDVSTEDRAWLDAHLDVCAACKRVWEDQQALDLVLRALPRSAAPKGLLPKVLSRARATGVVAKDEREAAGHKWIRWPWVGIERATLSRALRWRFAGGLAVGLVLVIGFIVLVSRRAEHSSNGSLRVEMSGEHLRLAKTPDFIVRMQSVGHVKARLQIEPLVRNMNGVLEEVDGQLFATLPRSALLPFLESLAQQGRYRVMRDNQGALDSKEVVVRFDVD